MTQPTIPLDSSAGETSLHPDHSPSNDQIRARAYELYLEHGSRDGKDIEDWLRAETEIREARDRSSNRA